MLRLAFGKVGGNVRRAFPVIPTMSTGGGPQLGMKRMLCSDGQKESRRAAGANPLMVRAMLGFGSLGLLGFYGGWAYPIERDIVLLRHGTSEMKTLAASRLYWNDEAEMGDIPSRLRDPLFALLRDGTLEGKAYAAMALLRGSRDSEDQQFKIAEAGGIEALTALLRNGTPDGKRTAAGGLLYAVQDAGSRHKIAETGGYEALAALLRDGTLEGKAIAAGSLMMISFFENDQQVQIADEGVLEAFIAVLGEGVPEMRKNEKGQAALCLSMAAKNADNRVKIIEAGGIELLKALLRYGTPYGKDQAATALEELTK
jgi:hypothetical protein